MACKQLKFTGKTVVLEYHIGCPDTLPQEQDWKRVGAMRGKELTLEWDTTDATADDSVGALRENLATFQNMSISGDGTVKVSGAGAAELKALTKHVLNPSATGGQPTAWMRLTFPDLTFVAYMLVSNMSRSAPHDDVVTYSLEASATSSDFGLIVDDTPDPNAPDVDSVTVTPSTMALDTGDTQQATVVVLPAGAGQGVVWQSDDTGVATVDQNGNVTGVSAGTCTVTVTSTADSGKSDAIAVTVSEP